MPHDGADAKGQGAFDPAASAGLFVGVSSFEDERIYAVPFAVDDAVDLAHLFSLELGLVLPERTVLLLAGEPRKPESIERLERLIERGARRRSARMPDVYRYLGELARGTEERGLFVLAVATHGVSDQGGDFLIATDSLRERTLRTGVAVAEVFDEVARAGAGRRLVLLDACRERLSQGTRSLEEPAMSQSFADAIAGAKGSAVLSGATLGGFAYDDNTRQNGVFTAAVLDGLRGAAPAGSDGWITVRTLADFVQQRVSVWVHRNRPDHAAKSLGIARRIEATAEALPLAPHPQATRERQRDRERQEPEAAQKNLRDFLSRPASPAILPPAPDPKPLARPRDKEPAKREVRRAEATKPPAEKTSAPSRVRATISTRKTAWVAGLSAFLLLLVFGGTQLYMRSEAQEIRRELAQPDPDMAALLTRYRAASAWDPLGIGSSNVRDELHDAFIRSAGEIIAAYHGDAPRTTEKGWQRARDGLRAALDLRPTDQQAQTRLIYVQAHLDRIAAGTLRAQGKREEVQKELETAVSGFRDAARRDAGWPDPYLGLARIYAYESFDLDELQKALDELYRRGYPIGQREKAMLADGFRLRGSELYERARRAAGPDGMAWLKKAESDLLRAVELYNEIPSYANVRRSRETALHRLTEIKTWRERPPSGF
jgi:hypothetical protein